MPDSLVEYRAVVMSPGNQAKVGEAFVSRFGYMVQWVNMTYTKESVDPPVLEKSVEALKDYLLKSDNTVADEVYTGIEISEQDIEKYTKLVPGENEYKARMKRYHDLMAAVTTRPWFRLGYDTVLSEGVRLLHIDGIDEQTPSLFFQRGSDIMVPAMLRFPYCITLRQRCTIRIDEYKPLDDAKQPGESDVDCIDRIAMKIARSFKENSETVDNMIAEHIRRADSIRRNVKTLAELAMIALSGRQEIDYFVASIYELCAAYQKLNPSSTELLDIPEKLTRFNTVVNLLCSTETKGKVTAGTIEFIIDKDKLDGFLKALKEYPLPDDFKSGIEGEVSDDMKISLRLVYEDDRLLLVSGSSPDPAASPYVE